MTPSQNLRIQSYNCLKHPPFVYVFYMLIYEMQGTHNYRQRILSSLSSPAGVQMYINKYMRTYIQTL